MKSKLNSDRVTDEMKAVPGILFVHKNNHPKYFGGIERKMISIIETLHKNNLFRCHLLTNHPESPLSIDSENAGATVHIQDMGGIKGLYETIKKINQIVDEQNINILQSHMFWGSLAAGTANRFRSQLKHIFRIHTHIAGSNISKLKLSAYHLADWMNSPGVDHYCVLSNVLKYELVHSSHVSEQKISILMNGIPELADPHEIQSSEETLPYRITVLGDLQPRKRQDLVIQALSLLKKRGLVIQCRFIGLERGTYGDELRHLAKQKNVFEQIEFAGFLDPIAPSLESSEVMVLTSDFEGVPTCMVEAMALNMLAVSSDVGGTSDLIEHGVNGFLIEPGKADKLADRLEMVFTTPSSDLAPIRKAGRQTFTSQCSLEAMINGLLSIYKNLGIEVSP